MRRRCFDILKNMHRTCKEDLSFSTFEQCENIVSKTKCMDIETKFH
jgi:hypothetical protein